MKREEGITQVEESIQERWEVGNTILNQYEITSLLGRGGFGEVFKIHHRGWNMNLAVKSLLPELFSDESEKTDFINECESWINLGLHPNIVSCYYVRNLGGIPRIFSEYMDAGNLRELLTKERIPIIKVLDIAIQIVDGLSHAHEYKLIHLDIKPENILLNSEEFVKITDFGIARALNTSRGKMNEDPAHTVRLQGSIPGTPIYMAPEQWDVSRGEIGPWTDFYALGVMIYEMLCGKRPFEHDETSLDALRDSHLNKTATNPCELEPDIPTRITELVRVCLDKDPTNRPQNCSEILQVLESMYKELAGTKYERITEDVVNLRADALNNYGVSRIDLGKNSIAISVFEDAIQIDPHHLEAVFNRGLLLWRTAKISDEEYLGHLTNVKSSDYRKTIFLSQVHLERSDVESAVSVLEEALKKYGNRPDLLKVLDSAKMCNVQPKRIVNFSESKPKIHRQYITFHPDGKRFVTISKEQVLEYWDTETGICLQSIQLKGEGTPTRLRFSPDGRKLVIGAHIYRYKTKDALDEIRVYYPTLDHKLVTRLHQARWPYLISPCGNFIYASGADGVQKWDIATGECIAYLLHTSKKLPRSFPIGFLSENTRILTNSQEGQLRIWDATSHECINTLKELENGHGPVGTGRNGAISGDGKWALTAIYPQSPTEVSPLVLWNLASGEPERIFPGLEGSISGLYLSHDGSWGLSNGVGGVRLWDLHSGQCIRSFTAHGVKTLNNIDISPSGKHIVGVGVKALAVWPLNIDSSSPDTIRRKEASYQLCKPRTTIELMKQKMEYEQLKADIDNAVTSSEWQQAAEFIKKARRISGYEGDRYLRDMWSIIGENGKRTGLVGIRQAFSSKLDMEGGDRAITVSNDGSLIALSNLVGKTLLWKWQNESVPQVILSEEMAIKAGLGTKTYHFFSENDDSLQVLLENGTYVHFSTKNGEILDTRKIGFEGFLNRVRFSENSSIVCILNGTKGGKPFGLWDTSTGKRVCELKGLKKDWSLTFDMTPDGKWIASAGYDRKQKDYELCLWDTTTGKIVQRMKGDIDGEGSIGLPVAISPDGKFLAVNPNSNHIHLWNIIDSKQIAILRDHTGMIKSLRFSPESLYLFSADSDAIIHLWALQSFECLNTQQVPGYDVAFQDLTTISKDIRWLFRIVSSNLYVWELEWDYEFE